MSRRKKRWRGLLSLLLIAVLLLPYHVAAMAADNGGGAGGGSSGSAGGVAAAETVAGADAGAAQAGEGTDTDTSGSGDSEETGDDRTTLNPATLQGSRAEENVSEETVQTIPVTLHLNGGSVNGLVQNGWNQTIDSYTYMKHAEPGTLRLKNPYRSGYDFAGWKLGTDLNLIKPESGNTYCELTIPDSAVGTQGWELTAVWLETLHTAVFQGFRTGSADPETIWTVRVPYGSVLWTMDGNAPWEADTLQWSEIPRDERLAETVSRMETASVTIELGSTETDAQSHEVLVTRYSQNNQTGQAGSQPEYYYTFTLEEVPYFTYGGKTPEYPGHHFIEWQGIGQDGFTVTEDDKIFLAQYTTKNSYLFHIHYYLENGMKAHDSMTIIVPEDDVGDGKIRVPFSIPSIRHYEPFIDNGQLPSGISVALTGTGSDRKGTLNADIGQVFADSTQTNPSVSVIVFYRPADIKYKIVYHLQNVGEGMDPDQNYQEIGYLAGEEKMGASVSIPDQPTELTASDGTKKQTDFLGYEADQDAQRMIRNGKRLEESLLNEKDEAVIHVYYNRIYYYLYTLTDSNESDPFDPVRVQYGAKLPADQDGTKLIKTGYTFEEWKWYQAGAGGKLELIGEGEKPDTMPTHDIYAVADWKAAKTKMQVVYWFEDANSGSFQNTYQKEVTDVPTGDRLKLNLESGNYKLTLETDDSTSFPAFTETFVEAIVSKYGDPSYKQYFSFDPVTTYQKELDNHHADGEASRDKLHYVVKADGTTTINLYYTRNLYTLQFVIQQNRLIASNTGGTMKGCSWHSLGSADTVFFDFQSSKIKTMEYPDQTFGENNVTVLKEYRLRDAVNRNDTRAAVGRYAKVNITENNITYPCFVYYLTARFEADIAELWPTLDNIKVQENLYRDPYKYISMGSNSQSAYWKSREDQKINNKNILNRYSTMDMLIINDRSGKACPDNEKKADVTHRMYAYWKNSGVRKYQYYFLYEVLDTTMNPDDYVIFNAETAYNNGYPDGTIVKWRAKNTDPYLLYVYRNNNTQQNSTANIGDQNQPARHGYEPMGKATRSVGNAGNVYYFYKREVMTLSIYNVNGNWVPVRADGAASDFLHIPLNLTYVNELTEQEETGEKSLAQLGWIEVVNTDSERLIHLRYGARIGVINQSSVVEAFQNTSYVKNPLAYPYKSLGVNQYYFYGWYKDQENVVAVDWNANAMQNMIQDEVLYTGWTTPKYRIIYALNGGTWMDKIHMTFMIPKVGDTQIVLYYPYKVPDPKIAKVFWYVPENKKDFLYVKTYYKGSVADLMEKVPGDDEHYKLKDLTLDEMIDLSEVDEMAAPDKNTVYLCNMGEEGTDTADTSHRKYVNQHIISGAELPEPQMPVKNGYDFIGWYAFDEEDEGQQFQQKIWLDTVIREGEGIQSYRAESVYLDASGAAHLLYEDAAENGRLFYYADQKGYRYRFEHGASISSQDRTLYAAWKGQLVNESKALYLVPKEEVKQEYAPNSWKSVTINGTEYYEVLDPETRNEIESGTLLTDQAKTLTTVGDGRIWLPEKAEIKMTVGDSVPTGQETIDTSGTIYTYTGDKPVFRIKIGNNSEEAYIYYSYFIYHPVDEPTYTVYLIDLAQAVLSGALSDYEDRFDRYNPPDANADYVLDKPPKKYTVQSGNGASDQDGGIVRVNAASLDGYTVYENWMETLQLEKDPNGNNIYFYYINPKNDIQIRIVYHFMENGRYNNTNVVSVTGYPGQTGQRIELKSLTEGYRRILDTAEQVRGYADSTNVTQQALYERYKEMVITSRADGINGRYAVQETSTSDGNASVSGIATDTELNLTNARTLAENYVVDRWTPTTSESEKTIILSASTVVHVYLRDATLRLNKKDSSGNPLKDAAFQLQRYRRLNIDEMPNEGDDIVVYQETQYVRDANYEMQSGVSDESGRVLFYDLSTNADAGYIYQITETQAPQGHVPLAEPVYVEVPYQLTDANGTTIYYDVTYDIINPGITYLPKAGGRGFTALMLMGGGMIVCGLFAGEALYDRKRSKRRKTR